MLSREIMLHVACNMPKSDNIQRQALDTLEARLPLDWRLKTHGANMRRSAGVAALKAPDGKIVRLVMELRRQMEPRDVAGVVEHLPALVGRLRNAVPLLISPFLTVRTRELLRTAGLSYLDLTGNCWITSRSPGLFIWTNGLDKNPQAEGRPVRSLKGPIAGRVVRALCDFLPPFGVRELAARVEANPGYVSRLLTLLEREALITRKGRGGVETVQWKTLIRMWADDYAPFGEEHVYQYLEPRGLSSLTDKLRKFDRPYAVTASMAAAAVAPVAPPRLATIYVDDPEYAGRALGLRRAESGINVRLVMPFDAVVYERTTMNENVTYAALSQVAADLLRSPGRGPEEATALLEWMAENENAWRH